jgi:uncharacterized protein YjbI with pentapeptide repeats
MMAIDWSTLGGLVFGIRLTECKASFSVFDGLNIQWCTFSQSDLSECSFRDCDLSGLKFNGCDLSRTDFQGARLIGTDLSGATGITLFPGRCHLRGTRVDMETAISTLAAQGIIVDG